MEEKGKNQVKVTSKMKITKVEFVDGKKVVTHQDVHTNKEEGNS